jgi:epoxyqueuosine reductase QueG
MKDKLTRNIQNFVLNNKENWSNETDDRFYDEPIAGFASVNDPLFSEYKALVAADHLTPKEVFELSFGKNSLSDGTVISIVLPVNEKLRVSNRGQKEWPSKAWILYRSFGDELFIDKVGLHAAELLTRAGFRAAVPHAAPWYKNFNTPSGSCSNWSERHIAYAAGLGTFSLNDGFITEKGIAIRLVSVITDLVLEADERKSENHLSNCLFYSRNTCGACIERCPIGAITKKGHDKVKCGKYAYGEESRNLAVSYGGFAKAGAGCGLCQTGIPCEYRNPTA